MLNREIIKRLLDHYTVVAPVGWTYEECACGMLSRWNLIAFSGHPVDDLLGLVEGDGDRLRYARNDSKDTIQQRYVGYRGPTLGHVEPLQGQANIIGMLTRLLDTGRVVWRMEPLPQLENTTSQA